MERATHPTRVVPTRIRKGDITVPKSANGMFRFPIAEGALKLNYIKHQYADVDNTHKESRTASQMQAEEELKEASHHLHLDAEEDEIAELFHDAGMGVTLDKATIGVCQIRIH